MLSKSKISHIKKLQNKKYRLSKGVFLAEGIKTIKTLLESPYELEEIFTVEKNNFKKDYNTTTISEENLKKISSQKSPEKAVAIFKIPTLCFYPKDGLIIGLNNLNNPGNLGAIIRLCHWYNIKHIICDKTTVDCYNPKVVQSSKGSLGHLNIIYTDLKNFIKNQNFNIYSATISGEKFDTINYFKNSIIVFGNESNGINQNILTLSNKTITIPKHTTTIEPDSLNIAISAGIILNHITTVIQT